MLTPESSHHYEQQSITRAGYCCSCTKPLAEDETYCCESCALESVVYRDPNLHMTDEEDG